jgi:hypothetical protein
VVAGVEVAVAEVAVVEVSVVDVGVVVDAGSVVSVLVGPATVTAAMVVVVRQRAFLGCACLTTLLCSPRDDNGSGATTTAVAPTQSTTASASTIDRADRPVPERGGEASFGTGGTSLQRINGRPRNEAWS